MTPEDLYRYHDQNTEERAAQRAAAAAHAETAADAAAALFTDEIAITARSAWPGATCVVFDLDTDGHATMHTVEDAAGRRLYPSTETPTARTHRPRDVDTTAVITSMFRTALSFNPTVAEPTQGPDGTTRYRLILPALQPRVVPLEPNPYGDTDMWDSPMVLRIRCQREGASRFGVVFTGPGGRFRRDFGAPRTPGPHARLYPLVNVIDGHPGTGAEAAARREAGREIYAHPGDNVLIGGQLFELRDDRGGEYPHLARLDPHAKTGQQTH